MFLNVSQLFFTLQFERGINSGGGEFEGGWGGGGCQQHLTILKYHFYKT